MFGKALQGARGLFAGGSDDDELDDAGVESLLVRYCAAACRAEQGREMQHLVLRDVMHIDLQAAREGQPAGVVGVEAQLRNAEVGGKLIEEFVGVHVTPASDRY